MTVSSEHAAEILAKCARHCSICRRFRPLHLQVHHIVERTEGGTDDLDNLIAICVSCHSDVHSNTKLTRRFSVKELQLHRDNVTRLVADGKLPSRSESLAIEEVSAAVIRRLKNDNSVTDSSDIGISVNALDVLLGAVSQQVPIYIQRPKQVPICIQGPKVDIPFQVIVGDKSHLPKADLPATALYPDFIIELVSNKLVAGNADELFVTEAGYAFADDILSANPNYTTIKVKCMHCGLHFVVCSWEQERHSADTLYCPECGQHQGNFSIWFQKMFGFICQMVPGSGQSIGGSSIELKRKRD